MITRRQTLLAGVGLLLTGCGTARSSRYDRPDPWNVRSYNELRRPVPSGPAATVTPPPTAPPVSASVAGLKIVPRTQWTRTSPIAARINPMNGIERITVHHEGSTPVWFADTRTTASRLEAIRRVHTADRGWADIGYHYVIDRSGVIWEGRPIAYQGAHVKDQNQNNLGVLVLGNFDQQAPTDAQMASLHHSLNAFMAAYRVPRARIHTHQELMRTACPGRNLQGQMAGVRRHLA